MLHSLGIAVSVDDFGTGYASLSNVALLDVDELKIDRSFISRFGMDVNSFAVVSSLSFLARIAGIRVVAEGVETTDELARWIHLGGQLVQGYLYSRPVDLDALFVILDRGSLLRLPEKVFPVEDFLLLNDALITQHLDELHEHSLQSCPFFDWFELRRNRWGQLEDFATAVTRSARVPEGHGSPRAIGPEEHSASRTEPSVTKAPSGVGLSSVGLLPEQLRMGSSVVGCLAARVRLEGNWYERWSVGRSDCQSQSS